MYISTSLPNGGDITPPALVSLFYWQTFSEKLWRNMKWGNRAKRENEKLRILIVLKILEGSSGGPRAAKVRIALTLQRFGGPEAKVLKTNGFSMVLKGSQGDPGRTRSRPS